MKKVIILWSGGWDGTFRMLQLSQYRIEIQPVYIIDRDRKSYEYELIAMEKIINILRKKYLASILDIIFYEKDWILNNCNNEIISNEFTYLKEKYAVGTQYEWFALLCNSLGVKMESSVVHQYHGKVEYAIDGEGKLSLLKDDILDDRYIVEAKDDNNKIVNVFGNLILPVIKLSKEDEYNIAKENDWLEIMKISWFCHTPINGKPCGLCGPCDDAMNTGMEWRVPKSARRRYKYRRLYMIIRNIMRRFGKDL